MHRPSILILALCAIAAAQEVSSPAPTLEGVYRAGSGVSAPRIVSREEPRYSEEALLAKLVGTVWVSVVVGADGTPRNFNITRSLGLGLDEAAIDAIRQWQFAPGMKDGNPVAVVATIEISFNLLPGDPRQSHWQPHRVQFAIPDGASRPTLVKAKLPSPAARDQKGDVTVSFDINEKGMPESVHADHSSDSKLEHDAISAVQEWRFHPAMNGGNPISAKGTLDFILGSIPQSTSPAPPPSR